MQTGEVQTGEVQVGEVQVGAASFDGEALLDWNESPLGPPRAAMDRVIASVGRLHRYPRGLMEEVTGLVADHLRVLPGQVLLTAGIDEAVDIALRLAERGWGVQPGFDGYPDRVQANGKTFHPIPLGPDWQPADSVQDLGIGAGDLVFLAQPGNPTGNLLDPAWVDAVRQAAQYVLIDETYQDFSSRPSVLEHGVDSARLLVYRSFSKGMGLAGIRVGALIADAAVIAELEPARRFMPIDAVSLNAAAGALEDPDYLKMLTAHVIEARAALTALLRASALFAEVRDTETNFVLARPAPGALDAILGALGPARIRIKNCDVLGLPGWFRISVGTWDEQQRLGDCLARVADALPTPAR